MRELDGCAHLCTRTTAQDEAEYAQYPATQMRRQATRGGLSSPFGPLLTCIVERHSSITVSARPSRRRDRSIHKVGLQPHAVTSVRPLLTASVRGPSPSGPQPRTMADSQYWGSSWLFSLGASISPPQLAFTSDGSRTPSPGSHLQVGMEAEE